MSIVRHESGPDAGAVWHYGDPMREQRLLARGEAGVDLSHRPVFGITGPDRLSWLNNIVTQKLDDLAPGVWTTAYILDPQGRIAHVFGGVDDGETLWASTEPGHERPLLDWLLRMRFAARAEIADLGETHAMVIAGGPRIVPRDDLDEVLGERRAGTWAAEALRIEAGSPRIFVDTDEKTIPNELANPDGLVLGPAVHLKKGCYPGQETVARVYTLGRPPRRLTLLHLDGSAEAHGTIAPAEAPRSLGHSSVLSTTAVEIAASWLRHGRRKGPNHLLFGSRRQVAGPPARRRIGFAVVPPSVPRHLIDAVDAPGRRRGLGSQPTSPQA